LTYLSLGDLLAMVERMHGMSRHTAPAPADSICS
jgi:hypothetical protein